MHVTSQLSRRGSKLALFCLVAIVLLSVFRFVESDALPRYLNLTIDSVILIITSITFWVLLRSSALQGSSNGTADASASNAAASRSSDDSFAMSRSYSEPPGLDVDRGHEQAGYGHRRQIIEHLAFGLWGNDFESPSEHFFSDAMFSMLGSTPLPPDKAMAFFLDQVHPEDADSFRVHADRVLMANGDDYYRSVFRLQHADGGWRRILSIGRCVSRDEQGYCRKIVGAHIDISDVKQLQAAHQ